MIYIQTAFNVIAEWQNVLKNQKQHVSSVSNFPKRCIKILKNNSKKSTKVKIKKFLTETLNQSINFTSVAVTDIRVSRTRESCSGTSITKVCLNVLFKLQIKHKNPLTSSKIG